MAAEPAKEAYTLAASEPQFVKVTNVRNASFVVSWVTTDPVTVSVNVTSSLTGTWSVEYDDRDRYDSQGVHYQYYLGRDHYVSVSPGTGLQPNTTYYFDIIAGGTAYDNGGSHYSQRTGPNLSVAPWPAPIGGTVQSSCLPTQNVIVYGTIRDGDPPGTAGSTSGSAAEMSALVGSLYSSEWSMNSSNARTADLTHYFYSSANDFVDLTARAGPSSVVTMTVRLADANPAPPMDLVGCTPTATATPTATETATPTATPTATETGTSTPTPTVTATSTGTYTATPTPTPTSTSTVTQTSTATATATRKPTETPSFTPTSTQTPTPTPTDTPTASSTPTSSSTRTPTLTYTATPTATSTVTSTATATPTATATATATRTSTPTPTATVEVLSADLRLSPEQTSACPDQSFSLDIRVDGATSGVDGAQAYVDFDKTRLNVVEIVPGTALGEVFQAQYSNAAGTIDYAAGASFAAQPATGGFVLATVRFRVLSPAGYGSSGVRFSEAVPRLPLIVFAGRNYQITPYASTVNNGFCRVAGHVTLQARPVAPDPSWAVALTVDFYAAGTQARLYTYNVTTDERGYFEVVGVAPGTYDVAVKNPHTLRNRRGGVVVGPGSLAVELGTLLEGDVDDNNWVNIMDFSLLRLAFGTGIGQPGFNAGADFNQDGYVNITDFSLLRTDFGRNGDVSVP